MAVPATAVYIGGIACTPDGAVYVDLSGGAATDLPVADGGTGASAAQGAQANLRGWYVLAQSAVAVSGAADTAENILATITVPANAIGPNGTIRIRLTASYTNSANDKFVRVRFSGIGGTEYITNLHTTTATAALVASISNRNATNSQIGGFVASNVAGLGTSTSAVVTSAVDTTAQTTIVITGQKETGAETLTLESYLVDLAYGA